MKWSWYSHKFKFDLLFSTAKLIWCNVYRCKKWNRRLKFESLMRLRLTSLATVLWKSMSPSDILRLWVNSGAVLPPDGSAGCSSTLEISLRPQGAIPPCFYPLREGIGLLPGAWGAPKKGNTDGAEGIFGLAGRVWVLALRPDSH